MRSRVLITGAAGLISNELIEYMEQLSDIEFIVGVEREEIAPGYSNTAEKIWIQKNLDEADTQWWEDTISNWNIDTVYYLESLENVNVFEADPVINRRFEKADSTFCEFLETRNSTLVLNILYLSTDKVYKKDKFPNEIHNLILPETTDEDNRYILNKITTENKILNIADVNTTVRIIRPFALTGAKQALDYPLIKMIKRFIDESSDDLQNGIPVYGSGNRGLTFTSIHDLVEFLAWGELFSTETGDKLITWIINFARVSNYLPETTLLEKIANKTESLVPINGTTEIDNFRGIQKTPQIKNLYSVWQPTTPIESILDEIIFDLNPVHNYASIQVVDISWDNNIPTISGTAEPHGTLGIYFPDGTGSITDIDSSGNWTLTKDEILTYEGTWYIHATTASQNQYDTVKILVPVS